MGQKHSFIVLSQCADNVAAFHVMMLKWHEGVAERIGVGVVDEWALDDSYPPGVQWKSIVLG